MTAVLILASAGAVLGLGHVIARRLARRAVLRRLAEIRAENGVDLHWRAPDYERALLFRRGGAA